MKTRSRPDPATPVISTATFAALAGVTPMTLTRWRREGMPGWCGHGRIELGPAVQWMLKRVQKMARSKSGPLTAERKKLLIAQTRGQAIANDAHASELLPADEVRMHLRALAKVVTAEMDALAKRAAVAAAAGDLAQVRRALEAECRETRGAVAAAWQRYGEQLALDDGAGHGD